MSDLGEVKQLISEERDIPSEYGDAILELIKENERLREDYDKLWRYAGTSSENLKAATQYVIRYTWLRKQVECRNPDLFVVNQNIGHDWIQVLDLDRAIDEAIEREEP